MQLKHLPIFLCLLICFVQLGQTIRVRSSTRSWRESLESFENENADDMIETFTPSSLSGPTVCMPKKRYETTLRVIDRMKDYMKTVESYMETCSRLSDSIRDRHNS